MVDGGRFPVKRIKGEPVEVTAVAFVDGHDQIAVELEWIAPDGAVRKIPMEAEGQDRFGGPVVPDRLGIHRYAVVGWTDAFETWRRGTLAKARTGLDVDLELQDGRHLLEPALAAAGQAGAEADGALLTDLDRRLAESADRELLPDLLTPSVAACVRRHAPRVAETRAGPYEVWVEPERARCSAWYEFFPRSASEDPSRAGTLADATARLPYVARMGFDTVYLPPIHPIGTVHRKGRNNARAAEPGDVGSPWAIGSRDGGHDAIHPELGTFEDFERFVVRARELGLEPALDVAFQCAPDHPWVQAHPTWFRIRADGSIQYAENPPKKYEDIYPLDFESEDHAGLWNALKGVFEFWIGKGVRTFRVDNPHTKAFPFWEWVIREIKTSHPEVVFLSEAFARPNVAYRLAKLGFTQSYDYFPWKNGRHELEEYFSDLAGRTDYFRASSWTNTPDILTEFLQVGGRSAGMIRAALASTLSASYGVYGPVFELNQHTAREPGSEEYLDSEKYEVRHWELDAPDSLAPFLAKLNLVRLRHPALRRDDLLRFDPSSNPSVVSYHKQLGADLIFCVVSLDPFQPQTTTVRSPIETPDRPHHVHELIGDEHHVWTGAEQTLRIDPRQSPARIYHVRAHVRTERDFDYFQ